jgi:hypothetical protein
MAAVIYRCPNTGFPVQGYTVDETIARDHDAYEPVSCLACKLVHLVNPKSGKVFVAGGSSGAHTPRKIFAICRASRGTLQYSPRSAAGSQLERCELSHLSTVDSE